MITVSITLISRNGAKITVSREFPVLPSEGNIIEMDSAKYRISFVGWNIDNLVTAMAFITAVETVV